MRTTTSSTPVSSSLQRLAAVWADITTGQRLLVEHNRPRSSKR